MNQQGGKIIPFFIQYFPPEPYRSFENSKISPEGRHPQSFLSFGEPFVDLLNSHNGKQPLNGDDADKCLCMVEIEDRQHELPLSFVISLSSHASDFGSPCTAVTLRASGKTQLKIEPRLKTYS